MSILILNIASAKVEYNFHICGDSMDLGCGIQKVNTVSSSEQLEVGAIYCYNYYKPLYETSDTRYKSHRLIEIKGDYLVMHGDNNENFYEVIPRKWVALKVL